VQVVQRRGYRTGKAYVVMELDDYIRHLRKGKP